MGKATYSPVCKGPDKDSESTMCVYPNPIKDGIIHLQLNHQPKGTYFVRLLNSLGQVILSKSIHHTGANNTENIGWNYTQAHGEYQLEVTAPDGKVTGIKLFY